MKDVMMAEGIGVFMRMNQAVLGYMILTKTGDAYASPVSHFPTTLRQGVFVRK